MTCATCHDTGLATFRGPRKATRTPCWECAPLTVELLEWALPSIRFGSSHPNAVAGRRLIRRLVLEQIESIR